MTKKKNVYTAQFKAEAIEMMKEYGVERTVKDLGVSAKVLAHLSNSIL